MGAERPATVTHLDPTLSVEDRVSALLGSMTLDEKVAQLVSLWLDPDPAGDMAPAGTIFPGPTGSELERLLDLGLGHLTRPLGTRPIEPRAGAAWVNRVQRRLVEGSRLGIPAICHDECLSGLMAQGATAFPSPLNLASTWDPELVGAAARVIGRQMRTVGVRQGLAPVSDVARDARWGRIEETLGEDPYLVGRLVTEYVRGLQGEDLREGVVATLKHFAAYGFSEAGRNFAPVHVGRRELADVFLLPFEMAVKEGGALGIMPAYTTIDGEPCHASRWLITEILKERWGFGGAVVADYGAIGYLEDQHRVAASPTEAAATALRAGVDVELPSASVYLEGVPDALRRSLLDMADVDEAVRRVLTLKVRLGLLENPYVEEAPASLQVRGDRELAREVALRSMTLLHNDGLLPLAAGCRVAVVGPGAGDPACLFGNYSFENHVVTTHFPELAREVMKAPSLLEVLQERAGAEILHAPGCPVQEEDRTGIAEAVAKAAEAEAALVVVGDKAGHFGQGTVGEGTDAGDLSLPGVQGELVDAVLGTGTPTVVVLVNGRPFALPDVAQRAAAVLEAWFPGESGARAIAEVIYGEANPGGRTPVTFSRGAGAQPRYYNHARMGRGVLEREDFSAVFPFGHGLSYSSFEYGELELPDGVATDGVMHLRCMVANTSRRDGDEVVQVYARDLYGSVIRPVRQLVAFRRVHLPASASARLSFEVPASILSFTGVDGRRVVEPGEIELCVGASSADIRLRKKLVLTGEAHYPAEERPLSSRVEVEIGS